MSRTMEIVCAALDVVDDREPGAVDAGKILAAVAEEMPDVSAREFYRAAEFLKQLASRLKGAGWRVDPANLNSFPSNSCAPSTGVGGQTGVRVREET
jgi:hypothetical protein